ncbi:hypothetical protein GGH20_005483, partial [Coemansia sp. RSA 1937]
MSTAASVFRRRLFTGAAATTFVWIFVTDNVMSLQMIKGRSMQPALNPDSNRLKNDVVLVDKTIRGMMSSRLKRGDIVTFTSPHDPDCHLVKRIIALPHDCIVPLSSPDSYVRIPNGQCWVEGDESFHSSDSNTFGPIPIALIDARVITP